MEELFPAIYGGLHKMGNSNDFYFEVEDAYESFGRFIDSNLVDFYVDYVSCRIENLGFVIHYDKNKRITDLEYNKYPKSHEKIVASFDTFLVELKKKFKQNKEKIGSALFSLYLKNTEETFYLGFDFKTNVIEITIEEYVFRKMGSEDLLELIKSFSKFIKPIGIYHDHTQAVYGLQNLRHAGFERNDVLFSDRKRDKFVNLKKKLDEITGKENKSNSQKIKKYEIEEDDPKERKRMADYRKSIVGYKKWTHENLKLSGIKVEYLE
jgi:hypothetical protein